MSDRITFRARRSTVIGGVLFGGIAGTLLIVLMSCVAFAAVRIGPMPQGMGVSLTTAIIAALGGGVLAREFWLRRTTSRFEIDDEHLYAIGTMWSRTVPLDHVRLIRLAEYARDSKTHSVIVRSTGTRRLGIMLPAGDALELFHALRQICAHAPALGLGDDRYDAIAPIDREASERYLSTVLRRKGWSMIVFGTAVLGLVCFMAVQTARGGSARSWSSVIIFGFASVGAIVAGAQRVHQAAHPVYDDDFEETD